MLLLHCKIKFVHIVDSKFKLRYLLFPSNCIIPEIIDSEINLPYIT